MQIQVKTFVKKMSARNSRPTPTTQIVNFIHTCCSHNLPTYHSYFVCTSQEERKIKLLFNEFASEHFWWHMFTQHTHVPSQCEQ